MKRTIATFFVLVLTLAHARADLVCERWAGRGATATHAGAMTVERGGSELRLVFDLSDLPAGAGVCRASLYCFTQGDVQPVKPAKIAPAGGDGPLKLQPPR